MLSILCLSRFGTQCQGRQCYDPHFSPTVSTLGIASVSVSFYGHGASLRVIRTSYYYLVTGVSVAWVSNRDDFCVVEVETLGEQISWYPRVVLRGVYIVSTSGSAFTTSEPTDCSLRYPDSPIVGMALLELLCVWLCVWERTQHQVFSRPRYRIPCQPHLLCFRFCSDWIDRVERTNPDFSATSTFLNHQTDNA